MKSTSQDGITWVRTIDHKSLRKKLLKFDLGDFVQHIIGIGVHILPALL